MRTSKAAQVSHGAPHGIELVREKGGRGRQIGFFMSAGQVSDYTGAAALLGSLPKAGWLLADRGYDTDWFREALKDKGIKVCIPGRKSRKKAVKYDKRRYKMRNRIEIMFGRLKRTGGASPRDTTGARKRSSPRSCSPQPYCSGFETHWVWSLERKLGQEGGN